jgi:hypothetical protein
VPTISVWNVWDLPLWAWRMYAPYVDDYETKAKEAERGN